MDAASISIMQIGAALLLFGMMSIVGMELQPADFRRVVRYPRAVVWGTVAQLVLLPLATFALLDALSPPPLVAAGAILVLAAPGGGISNVFALLAGANPALSVTLTATASVLSAVSFPLIASVGLERVMGEATAVELPLVPMMGQLVALVLIPIGLGMWVRLRWPEVVRHGPRLRHAAFAGAVVMIGLGIASDDSGLAAGMLDGFGTALVWTCMALAMGYGIGALLRLDTADRLTLAIEFGVKNVALAAIVAMAALGRPDLAVFSGAYVATAYPLVGIASVLRRRWAESAGGGSGP
ncbi:MAG: bile acid:sodium symporter family protein [Myxococcota bacterium]